MNEAASQVNRIFYITAAMAAILTAATNLYIHLTDFPANSFEERILLFKNNAYVANRIIIIIHCLLVIVSTLGMGLLLSKHAMGFAVLGILSFIVFGLTEISRMMFSLNYVNGLREKYFTETNPQLKQLYEYSLNNAGMVNNIFFRIFIVAFALGLLCYGIALVKREIKTDRVFGWLTLLLSAITFISFANDFAENKFAGDIVHWASITLQPLVRLWMGVWIIQNGLRQSINNHL